MIIEKLEKSIELKSKEYNFLLISKDEQIKMLSNEVLTSKQEKQRLKDQELEIGYLKNKVKRFETLLENTKTIKNETEIKNSPCESSKFKNTELIVHQRYSISQPESLDVSTSNIPNSSNSKVKSIQKVTDTTPISSAQKQSSKGINNFNQFMKECIIPISSRKTSSISKTSTNNVNFTTKSLKS